MLNAKVLVYELSGCRFESRCIHFPTIVNGFYPLIFLQISPPQMFLAVVFFRGMFFWLRLSLTSEPQTLEPY